MISPPRRLFILRPDHLGDLVLFSGALREIRNQWPETHITLCVRSYGRQLFAACPHVDALFPYERLRKASPINWIPYFPGARRVRQALQVGFGAWLRRIVRPGFLSGLQCDLAVMPLRSPEEEYHWIMRLIPASARLGISGNLINQSRKADQKSRAFYSAQIDSSNLPADFPEFEMTSNFLRFMGVEVEAGDLWPEFWTKDADKEAAEKLMGFSSGHRTLGIAPGNVLPGKRHPPQWFVEAINGLAGEPLQVVLLGSPGDIEYCKGVEQALQGAGNVARVLNITGRTNVREMIECLRRCEVVLAQETAALHIAVALRKPVLGIVGGGQYGRFFPWGDPALARVATKTMDCFGCNWVCKYASMRCIQEITPQFAAFEIAALLAGAAGAH